MYRPDTAGAGASTGLTVHGRPCTLPLVDRSGEMISRSRWNPSLSERSQYRRYRSPVVILTLLLVLSGCAASPDRFQPDPPVAVDAVSRADWEQMDLQADSRDALLQRVRYYQSVSGDDGIRSEAYTRETSLLLLLGAAYSESRSEQRRWYRMATQASEQALLLVDSFREARQAGQSVPEAAVHLDSTSFEPLFLWTTATFYHFRDVASVTERILFNRRLKEAANAIEVMLDKDPDWSGGALQFSLGIYYLSVPEIIGGDRDKARELMEVAVRMSDKRLLPAWGRAKYLAVSMGDRKRFQEDLEWVLRQDVSSMEGPAIWNRYFMEDARQLLDQKDLLFHR